MNDGLPCEMTCQPIASKRRQTAWCVNDDTKYHELYIRLRGREREWDYYISRSRWADSGFNTSVTLVTLARRRSNESVERFWCTIKHDKRLSYCRGTAGCCMSVYVTLRSPLFSTSKVANFSNPTCILSPALGPPF